MSTCKCGKTIIWGTDENGTKHPLDPVAPVYQGLPSEANNIKVIRLKQAWVSHFATCRFANDFSKKKEKNT